MKFKQIKVLVLSRARVHKLRPCTYNL